MPKCDRGPPRFHLAGTAWSFSPRLASEGSPVLHCVTFSQRLQHLTCFFPSRLRSCGSSAPSSYSPPARQPGSGRSRGQQVSSLHPCPWSTVRALHKIASVFCASFDCCLLHFVHQQKHLPNSSQLFPETHFSFRSCFDFSGSRLWFYLQDDKKVYPLSEGVSSCFLCVSAFWKDFDNPPFKSFTRRSNLEFSCALVFVAVFSL